MPGWWAFIVITESEVCPRILKTRHVCVDNTNMLPAERTIQYFSDPVRCEGVAYSDHRYLGGIVIATSMTKMFDLFAIYVIVN